MAAAGLDQRPEGISSDVEPDVEEEQDPGGSFHWQVDPPDRQQWKIPWRGQSKERRKRQEEEQGIASTLFQALPFTTTVGLEGLH